jgi:hypothetical protein
MELVQTDKYMKNHENKDQRKGLSLIFKQGTKQNYVIQKQQHKMCKKNVKTNIYYANM